MLVLFVKSRYPDRLLPLHRLVDTAFVTQECTGAQDYFLRPESHWAQALVGHLAVLSHQKKLYSLGYSKSCYHLFFCSKHPGLLSFLHLPHSVNVYKSCWLYCQNVYTVLFTSQLHSVILIQVTIVFHLYYAVGLQASAVVLVSPFCRK